MESYHDYHGVKGNSLKSGCKIYFKEEINLNSCKDLEITYFDEDNEFRCGWIEFLNEKRSSIFAGLYYRHPKSSLITCFYQKWKKYWQNYITVTKLQSSLENSITIFWNMKKLYHQWIFKPKLLSNPVSWNLQEL